MSPEEGARALLARVSPFQFLSTAQRDALAQRMEERRYAPGDTLVRAGETSRDVFLLADGRVACIDERDPPLILSTIRAGHYFGERASLFEQPREVSIRAEEPVRAYTLPGKDFIGLVEEVPTFAQALATALKVKQGIFQGYRRLYARILTLLDEGEFLLTDLLDAYAALHPALHPHLHEERIDVGALAYAVARLPRGITRTSFYYLAGTLPDLYRDPDAKFDAIETKARRRSAWKVLPGKTFVLLRDGISDVTDLLTCLCLYAYEARKIRHRLRSSEVLVELKRLVEEPDADRALDLLQTLELSAEERDGLLRIWPERWPVALRNILLHHEDIALECEIQIDDYNSRASEIWVSQIQELAGRLVDLEDPELQVHLISSNTHSFANCLSPYLADNAEAILAWGKEHRPDLTGEPSKERPWGAGWQNPRDLLYAISRHYLKEVPGAAEAMDKAEKAAGHYHLSTTAFTGIEVDLFCAQSLAHDRTDPDVRAKKPSKPTLIVNVDYAFGQQAEEILANLLFVFGRRVRSINVVGKAGGLVGERGQLLLPNATLLQTNDELYPLPNGDLSVGDLRELTPDLPIHSGPVLTVAGTLLQDRALLHFYRRIWKCVGLEMEGSFFARQIVSAVETGVCRADVKTRFAYYTSDVPLNPDETLSEPMRPWEGVPPLYAITRAILNRIFAQS